MRLLSPKAIVGWTPTAGTSDIEIEMPEIWRSSASSAFQWVAGTVSRGQPISAFEHSVKRLGIPLCLETSRCVTADKGQHSVFC